MCALAAAFVGACAPAAAAPRADAALRLRVVHTSDLHGRLLPQTPTWAAGRSVGGAAVLAAHFDSAAARFHGPTLVLSAGDDLQGTLVSNLSWGRATVDAMNAAGYDAAALGNHEFDWGQDTLRARVAESRFPWLAANLYVAGTGEHPAWVRPWVMIDRGGVRTAVVGVAFPETAASLPARLLEGLQFGPAAPAIIRSADEARRAGAHFVVAVMHIGAACEVPGQAPTDVSAGCAGPVLEAAEATHPAVDLVVGGHTHQRVLSAAGDVPVAVAASYGVAYSVTDLERRGGQVRVLARSVATSFADAVAPDSAAAAAVDEWNARVRPLAARVVTRLDAALQDAAASRSAEFPLGILIAEAQRFAAGAELSLLNSSAVRGALPQGPVTYEQLFQVQPFQNELVRVRISGRQLRGVLERALTPQGEPDAQLAGVLVTYDPARAAGSRIVQVRRADGSTVTDDDTVTIGTTEFMVAAPRYPELGRGVVTRLGIKDVDALVQYLAAQPVPVAAPAPGRWRRAP